jgi:outer membrane protein assembly factor BamA
MVLASRVRVGTMSPFGDVDIAAEAADPQVARVPREDRFKTGGVNSIRGFDENRIPPDGGLAVLQGNLELRIPTRWKVPFLGPLGLEAFVDAGNVWPRASYIKWDQFRPAVGRDSLDAFDVRYAVGFGPRIDLPIGPLRLDVAWTPRPAYGGPAYGRYEVQFAIGPSF